MAMHWHALPIPLVLSLRRARVRPRRRCAQARRLIGSQASSGPGHLETALQTATDCHSRYAWARTYLTSRRSERERHTRPSRASMAAMSIICRLGEVGDGEEPLQALLPPLDVFDAVGQAGRYSVGFAIAAKGSRIIIYTKLN